MKTWLRITTASSALCLLSNEPTRADNTTPAATPGGDPSVPCGLTLPSVFTHHMVLQQRRAAPVWGWAPPGTPVRVTFRGNAVSTEADAQGAWRVRINTGEAGGPFELDIRAEHTIVLRDVLVGEVWLCAGQSNMAFPLSKSLRADAEIPAATDPAIRLLTVSHEQAAQPRRDINSWGWMPCHPATARSFSAVAYHFARAVREHHDIPIGLIESSWGGAVGEAFIGAEGLSRAPGFESLADTVAGYAERAPDAGTEQRLEAWRKSVREHDNGFSNPEALWKDPGTSVDDWRLVSLPASWQEADLERSDTLVWFRRQVDIPAAWSGRCARLSLGSIAHLDTTWFDGVEIGGMHRNDQLCRYAVPAERMTPGPHHIAVRVDTLNWGGAFLGPADQMKLELNTGERIDLAGAWHVRVGARRGTYPSAPKPFDPRGRTALIYHAMIAPLAPFAIRGVLWYQGEANVESPNRYRTLFPAIIRDWRRRWAQGDFPFIFVQLPNYGRRQKQPHEDALARFRAAQAAALALPSTAMAVTIDIGKSNDIHPPNKRDVGVRLALQARTMVYGETLVDRGPVYRSARREGSRVRITFDHIGSGLESRGGSPLKGFALADADGRLCWADAIIDGDTVLVDTPEVENPATVQYAWQADPPCSLYNREGLPAAPFRAEIPPPKDR